MTILGNIFLFLAAIAAIAINTSIAKPPPRNDASVGYFWGILILSVAFLACMIVVCAVVGFKGGYYWVASQKLSRFLLVTAGLFAAVFTIAVTALFKHENGPAIWVLRIMSLFAPFVIPILLIGGNFILLNKSSFGTISSFAYRLPLTIALIIGIAGTVATVFDWAAQSARNNKAKIKRMIEDQENNHNRMLAEIDSCDVMKNMVFILVFADGNQDADVCERAVAKIKTHPEWQQELVRRLESDWAPEAFNFLASNNVDDPSLFPAAINEGILIQAKLIRESIRGSSHVSHFYEGRFSWEVERVLRTADRFRQNQGDFLAAAKQLRAALNTSSKFKEIEFSCIRLVDDWIKKNQA